MARTLAELLIESYSPQTGFDAENVFDRVLGIHLRRQPDTGHIIYAADGLRRFLRQRSATSWCHCDHERTWGRCGQATRRWVTFGRPRQDLILRSSTTLVYLHHCKYGHRICFVLRQKTQGTVLRGPWSGWVLKSRDRL